MVFHAFLVGVAEFAVAPVEDASGEAVAALLEVADGFDVTPGGPNLRIRARHHSTHSSNRHCSFSFLALLHRTQATGQQPALCQRGLGEVGEHVGRLEDPSVVGEGLAELGGFPCGGEHADDVVGADGTGVDRRGDAGEVGPVAGDAFEVDAAAGSGVEWPVVGVAIDASEFGVGDVGELRAVVESEEVE